MFLFSLSGGQTKSIMVFSDSVNSKVTLMHVSISRDRGFPELPSLEANHTSIYQGLLCRDRRTEDLETKFNMRAATTHLINE